MKHSKLDPFAFVCRHRPADYEIDGLDVHVSDKMLYVLKGEVAQTLPMAVCELNLGVIVANKKLEEMGFSVLEAVCYHESAHYRLNHALDPDDYCSKGIPISKDVVAKLLLQEMQADAYAVDVGCGVGLRKILYFILDFALNIGCAATAEELVERITAINERMHKK